MMSANPPFYFTSVYFIIFLLYGIAQFAIHSAFAFAVDRDAGKLKRSGGQTVFVNGSLWAVATLIGGPMVAAAYWVINRSMLNERRPAEPATI